MAWASTIRVEHWEGGVGLRGPRLCQMLSLQLLDLGGQGSPGEGRQEADSSPLLTGMEVLQSFNSDGAISEYQRQRCSQQPRPIAKQPPPSASPRFCCLPSSPCMCYPLITVPLKAALENSAITALGLTGKGPDLVLFLSTM